MAKKNKESIENMSYIKKIIFQVYSTMIKTQFGLYFNYKNYWKVTL